MNTKDSNKKKGRPIPKGRMRRPAYAPQEAQQEAHAELEQRTVELRADIEALHREIAERERAQAALRQSERKYRELFESAHDAILIFRPEDEVVLEVNQRACDLYGFSRSEFIGMSLEKISKDVQRGKAHIGLTLDQGTYHRFETVQFRKDGSEMFLEINASRVSYQGQWAIQSINRDITERKRAEEALRNSEEAFRLAFEGAKDALFWADPQTGLITNCNKAAEDLLEKAKEEIIGQHQTTLHSPQKRDLYAQIFNKHIQEKGGAEEEAEIITKSGKVKTVIITASVTMVGGKPIIQGIFRDITDRKRAEEALKQEHNLLERLAETSPAGITIVNREGQIVFANAQAEQVLGLAKDVITQLTYNAPAWRITDYAGQPFPDEELPFQKVMATAQPVYDIRHAIEWPNGQRVLLTINASPLYDQSEQLVGMVATVEDITRKVRTEEHLAYQANLLANVHDAVIAFDEDFTVTAWNRAAEEMYGWKAEEVIGRKRNEVLNTEYVGTERDEAIRTLKETGWFQGELIQQHRGGQRIYAETKAVALKDPAGRTAGYVSVNRDITERKRAAEALRESEKCLKEAQAIGRIGSWEFDPESKTLVWSDQTFALYERNRSLGAPTPEEEAGYYSPEQSRALREYASRAIETGQGSQYDLQPRLPSGRTCYFLATMRPVKNETGRVVKLIGTVQDITERKQAEEALRESEERYRSLVNQTAEGFVLYDAETRKVIDTNPAYRDLLGYSGEEILGLSIYDIVAHDREDIDKHFQRILAEKSYFIGERRHRRKDGSLVDVEASSTLVSWGGKKVLCVVVRDITARKQAAEALKESEEKYRLLVENSKQGILVLQDGLLKFANPRAIEYSGYSQAELTSTPFLDLVYSEDRGMVAERYQRRLRGEDIPNSYQFRFINKQGQARWVEVYSVLITWKGKPAALSFLSDIHERWLAEEALRESEEKYRLVVEHASDAILVAQDGMMKFLNHRVKELTGYSERELTSRPFLEFIHPEDRQMVAERHQSRLLGKAVPPVYPFRIVTKAGEDRWVEIHAITIPWQGKPATLNFLTDITERRRAEEALRESEALSRAVIEHSPVGISVRTRDGALLQVNEAWKKIWAMSNSEIEAAEHASTGKSFEERFPYLGNQARDVGRIFSPGGAGGGLSILFLPELEVKDPRPGAARWISQYFYAFRDERGRGDQVERVITLTQNITLRKQLEEQFLQAQKLEAVGRLAGGVAHDFNNLLTGIMGYSDLLCQKLKGPGGDQALLRYAEVILNSANRASNLTQQLLSLSRRHVARLQVLDLSAAVAETNKMLRRLIGEDLEFVARLDPSLGRVRLDPVQLEQVVMNLAVNARDAMPQGGRLTIQTANVVLDEAFALRHLEVVPGPYAMLSLSDTGHGMGREIQAHLFEPFFTTKEKGKGTGLGLSTVYGIVKQNGGHIEVESAPGKGTTFKIYFPRVAEHPAPATSPGPDLGAGGAPELPRGTETVLLAEDDEEVRAFALEVLRSAGYSVLLASDGEEAIEVAGQHPGRIHILVTDVLMPRLSGPALAARLLPLRQEMKVLYMSGYTAGEVASRGGLDSNPPFLQKPFQGEVLLARVREVLGGREGPS